MPDAGRQPPFEGQQTAEKHPINSSAHLHHNLDKCPNPVRLPRRQTHAALRGQPTPACFIPSPKHPPSRERAARQNIHSNSTIKQVAGASRRAHKPLHPSPHLRPSLIHLSVRPSLVSINKPKRKRQTTGEKSTSETETHERLTGASPSP